MLLVRTERGWGKKVGEVLKVGVTVVSASEVQAEGLLSDPCAGFGRRKGKSIL